MLSSIFDVWMKQNLKFSLPIVNDNKYDSNFFEMK